MSPETWTAIQQGGAAVAVVLIPAFFVVWARLLKVTDDRIANADRCASQLAASTEALKAATAALAETGDALDRSTAALAPPQPGDRRPSFPGARPR